MSGRTKWQDGKIDRLDVEYRFYAKAKDDTIVIVHRDPVLGGGTIKEVQSSECTLPDIFGEEVTRKWLSEDDHLTEEDTE